MDIILDTNILRKDIKLKGKDFEILLDYVAKTDSKIVLSEIVIKEITNLYKKMISEKIDEIQIRLKKLNSTLIDNEVPELPAINLDIEAAKYLTFLQTKLNILNENILPIEKDFLPDLVNRAIEKKKPLGNDGQQFRDGILWLSTLKYAVASNSKKVIFITENTSDFCGSDKTSLDKELQIEVNNSNVEILFYKSISSFSEQHSSVIEFITDEWINANLDSNILSKLFWDSLTSCEEDSIIDCASLDGNEKTTGNIERTDYINFSKDKYFVYEKEDGTILLSVKFTIEQEFLIEIERTIENDDSSYEYSYNYNPATEDFDLETQFVPQVNYEIEYENKVQDELFNADFIITIKDQTILNYEIKNLTFK